MATKIYDSGSIYTVDNLEIYITPLKIKYLREFMEAFELVKAAKDDTDAVFRLVDCIRIAMKQYHPEFKTIEDIEDNFDIHTIYKVLDLAAGIKMNSDNKDEPVSNQASDSGSTWEKLDLAKLESEAFLLGIWKDFEDLESHISMPELIAILDTRREDDYRDKKFLAAIQGVDLDKQANKTNAWEDMKARVFSKGKAKDANDITALQGINAQKAGFGIGMGLGYEDLTKK